jgi:hypothetical protein
VQLLRAPLSCCDAAVYETPSAPSPRDMCHNLSVVFAATVHADQADPHASPCAWVVGLTYRDLAVLPGEVTVDEPSPAAREPWYRRLLRSKRRALLLGLALVFLVSSLCVVLLAALGMVDLDTVWDDLAKTLLQVGLVSAGAALLSLFSYEYQQEQRREEARKEQERRREEARQEWLRQLLARATVAYNDVKSARRLLRARAITLGEGGQEIVRLDDYDHQIDTIIKAQLQFETLADEVLDATAIPPTDARPVRDLFQSLEESLQRLVREYQRERAQFSGKPATLRLDQLPHLDEFQKHLGTDHSDDEVQKFQSIRGGFHDAQNLIWKELEIQNAAWQAPEEQR